jgi:hypothetical protein
MSVADASLVINLSAGDATYGHLTAKALAEAHRATVKEIIIVVDSIKAPFATFYDHAKRYAEPRYSDNVKLITAAAYQLKNEGLADQIIELKSGDQSIKRFAKQYFNNRFKGTHDFRGAPITAYIAGLEACTTKYMVRYDGDILLHQSPDADWILKGIELLETEDNIIAISPCPAPSEANKNSETEFTDVYWFSTRCLLINKQKLMAQLPFIDYKYWAEITLRKILKRTYPPAFETMLTKKLQIANLKTRYLIRENAWFLHPEDKGQLFLDLLSSIIKKVKEGKFPSEQANKETLNLDAWKNYLEKN